jgi:hypothetical protein
VKAEQVEHSHQNITAPARETPNLRLFGYGYGYVLKRGCVRVFQEAFAGWGAGFSWHHVVRSFYFKRFSPHLRCPGGNDLIAKPFLMMELAVKALTYLLKPAARVETKAKPAP